MLRRLRWIELQEPRFRGFDDLTCSALFCVVVDSLDFLLIAKGCDQRQGSFDVRHGSRLNSRDGGFTIGVRHNRPRRSVQPRELWRSRYSHFGARPGLDVIGEPVFRLVSDPLGQMSSDGRNDCRSALCVASSVGPLAVVIVRMIGDSHGLTSVSVRLWHAPSRSCGTTPPAAHSSR